MVSMAFFATVLNYVHRLSFNYLSADGELRKLIPDDAFGYIGAAFFVAYMLSNAFSGLVIDKLGTRIGYSLCMAFWTTAGLDGPEEKRDSAMGPPVYYSVPGIPQTLEAIAAAGCVCRHLEYDQWPEKHLFLIAQKL